MKIYLAAPWADKDLMPEIADKFLNRGHSITHAWWEVENVPEGERSVDLLREQADMDVEGVAKAQILVLLNTSKSEGKAIEQGIAIRDGKPIIAVGQLGAHSKNVFHYRHNYRWVDTIDDALEVLDVIEWLFSGDDEKGSPERAG